MTASRWQNDKEPRMDTNVHDESTEYTEETDCLADVGHRSVEVVGNSES